MNTRLFNGELSFTRYLCGSELGVVPDPFLVLGPDDHPMQRTANCGLLELDDGRLCIVGRTQEGCEGGRWNRDQEVYCVDPDAANPQMVAAFSIADILDTVDLHPGWERWVGFPVERTIAFVDRHLALPDGRILFLVRISHSSARLSDAGARASFDFQAIVSYRSDEGFRLLANDLTMGTTFVFSYDEQLDAVLMGPLGGIELDDRDFLGTVDMQNDPRFRGSWMGLGLHVVKLDGSNQVGIMSLSDGFVRDFPDITFRIDRHLEWPQLSTEEGTGTFAYEHGGEIYRMAITDYDKLDLDFDGLSAARERELGTSDFRADSDNDSIQDHLEVHMFQKRPRRSS